MSTPQAVGLTVADLDAMPEDMAVRNLVAGDLFVTPAPSIRHQRVVTEILWRLRSHQERHGGIALAAPAAVRLSDRDVLEPDVLFVADDHAGRVGDRYIEGPPDLVVEVSSPSTRRLDLVRKRRVYERFTVAEYWFVDLAADRIEAYVLRDGRYGAPTLAERGAQLRSASLEGFAVTVNDVIAG